jgi:hypothetical protein
MPTGTKTTSSKPSGVGADVDSELPSNASAEANPEDWLEEELGPCMEVTEEQSGESGVETPCRRMLTDYGSPGHNPPVHY